jgi:hypothetical protein
MDAAAREIRPQSYEDKLGLRDLFDLLLHIQVKDYLVTIILQHAGHEGNVYLIMKSRVHTRRSLLP